MTVSEASLFPDAVAALPPSSKLVYRVLDNHGPLTEAALVELTGCSSSTIHDGLQRLAEAGVVTEYLSPDARGPTYDVAE